PRSTLFPYTTLFRSGFDVAEELGICGSCGGEVAATRSRGISCGAEGNFPAKAEGFLSGACRTGETTRVRAAKWRLGWLGQVRIQIGRDTSELQSRRD